MCNKHTPLPKLLEEKKADNSAVNIPYKKYQYPNGLTVILHEDKSDPIVYVDVTYHVGSARETPGRSGFAHFFEHMMFNGSDNVSEEGHFATVTEAGGTLNGTTNRDRTNYFETLPSNHLETALWLEADRMGYLLDAVTLKKFEIQRATVKNERQQNYENRPYGLVGEKIGEALYPFGHPYSWTTIGYLEDIDKFELQDLKNFFLRWYGPNNATLTIAGDFDEQETLKLIGKYFGNIPRGPEVSNMEKVTVELPNHRYISYEDNINFPLLSINYHGAPANTKDEVALDVLAYLLGGSNNKKSPFYQRFVKTQKAMQASVSNPASELAGQITMTVVAYPNYQLKDLYAEVQEILREFENTPINEDIFNEYVTEQYSDLIYSIQSVQRKGALLASYETFTGNPAYFKETLKHFKELTVEDVRAAYNKYIKDKNAVILSVYNKKNPDNIVAPDNYKRPEVPVEFKPDLSEYENLTYIKGKDDFDRSKQPAPGKNPVVEIPKFWNAVWNNGTKVIGTSYDELPITNITYIVKAGKIIEPIEKAGISTLLASLLNEGTLAYTSEQFQSELKKIGSKIAISADNENIIISATSLNEHLQRTIELLNYIYLTPRFDVNDFERLKKQQIQAIQSSKTDASNILGIMENRMLYPDGNINSVPRYGTEESVSNITLEDVKAYFQKYFAPDHAELIIVGNISKNQAPYQLSYLYNAEKKNVTLPAIQPIKTPEKTTIVFAHKDKSPQSQIKVVGKGLTYDGTGEYYIANIANYPLGGMFNSRININLRERKGWTYGARSNFLGTQFVDKFQVTTNVKGANTDSSVIEIMKELNDFVSKGISKEELEFTKKSIGQRDALKYETAAQKASFMSIVLENDFDADLVKKQLNILNTITKDEIDAIAKKYIQPDQMYIFVVGDKSTSLEPLQQLGYPVIEMNIDEQ